MTTAFVHSTEAGSAVDGPGMRFLIFLAGCSFRCGYCHNPDTWDTSPSQQRSLESVLQEIESYAPWLQRTGGITISGGEPLRQPEFVHALCSAVKERWNIHTAIETQGFFAPRLADDWFAPIDLVLLDIKHIDDTKHRELTGGFAVEATLATARRLAALGKEMWIRHVVVPGYTDTLEHMQRMAEFVATLPTVTRVELLPFHQLGSDKWKSMGIAYPFEGVRAPDPDFVEELRAPFRALGIETV